jgi:iron complex transport system substrate-binding protein
MKNINAITKSILDAAFKLHTMYGPGLYETAYELLLFIELKRTGHVVERQKPVSIEYEGVVVDNAFRLDLLVDSSVIVELKSTEQRSLAFSKQLKTYLVLCNKPVGLLINFGQVSLKNGIERVVNNYDGPPLPTRNGTSSASSANSA